VIRCDTHEFWSMGTSDDVILVDANNETMAHA
jgi:hypothetical protein